jgi:hypothetical protein
VSLPIRFATSILVLISLILCPLRARADTTVDRCIDANTQAQSLQREAKLGAAREQLKLCADVGCPALVRSDCTQRLDELDRTQPTVVFEVKDGAGHDLLDVNVKVDGRPFAERLDGMALAADPGEHTFTFVAAGRPAVTQQFVLRVGEKERRERILIEAVTSSKAVFNVVVPPRAAPDEESSGIGLQKGMAIAAFGVGLVALGTGVAFAVSAQSKADDANTFCPLRVCSNQDALKMNHDAVLAGKIATVAFAAGAAGIGAAALLWLTAKPSSTIGALEVRIAAGAVDLRGSW